MSCNLYNTHFSAFSRPFSHADSEFNRCLLTCTTSCAIVQGKPLPAPLDEWTGCREPVYEIRGYAVGIINKHYNFCNQNLCKNISQMGISYIISKATILKVMTASETSSFYRSFYYNLSFCFVFLIKLEMSIT